MIPFMNTLNLFLARRACAGALSLLAETVATNDATRFARDAAHVEHNTGLLGQAIFMHARIPEHLWTQETLMALIITRPRYRKEREVITNLGLIYEQMEERAAAFKTFTGAAK